MIHSFSCKNFYSFKDKTSVSFVVNENAPKNNGYFVESSGTRLSKFETVIGSNASGKTNILKVLPFLRFLIVDAVNIPDKAIPVKPFFFDDHKDKPIELSVEFEINKNIFVYKFILNGSRILLEELRIKNKTKHRTTDKLLFLREWNKDKEQYDFREEGFELPKKFKNALRTNASVIGSASLLKHKKSEEIINFWREIGSNVVEFGWAGSKGEIIPGMSTKLFEALDFYSEAENVAFKEAAENILSRFDLGFKIFDIEKEVKENSVSINARVVHSFSATKKYFPITYESSGTKQLIVILRAIQQVLAVGGVMIWDEIDTSLHPQIVAALFELFLSPETNPRNAQIIFSTHNHIILSQLDKYQIILTEKNENGSSEAWRLDEMSGVRSDDNFYNKYIAGAYGAIPRID